MFLKFCIQHSITPRSKEKIRQLKSAKKFNSIYLPTSNFAQKKGVGKRGKKSGTKCVQ